MARSASIPLQSSPSRWVWLKIKELGLRKCSFLVSLTKVPFWYRCCEPQPGCLPCLLARYHIIKRTCESCSKSHKRLDSIKTGVPNHFFFWKHFLHFGLLWFSGGNPTTFLLKNANFCSPNPTSKKPHWHFGNRHQT